MRIYELRLEPFDMPFTVALGDKARRKALVDAGAAPDYTVQRGAVYTVERAHGLLPALVVHLPTRKDLVTINHEALHLVVTVMERHGIPLAGLNQEWLCFMQEYAVRLILNACYNNRTAC